MRKKNNSPIYLFIYIFIFNLFVIHSASSQNHLSFVVPNEENPIEMLETIKEVPPGAVVAVGTERGFITASLAKETTQLILVDKNPTANLFNQINTILLKTAVDRTDYLFLRLHAPKSEWFRLLNQKINYLNKEVPIDALWDWWNDNVRLNQRWKAFNRDPNGYYPFNKFQDANYLHYDYLFDRISKLAKSNKIFSYEVNLKDKSQSQLFIQLIKNYAKEISIIDLSNLWDRGHLGHYELINFIFQMRNNLLPLGIIQLTTQPPKYSFQVLKRSLLQGPTIAWKYFGIPKESLGETIVEIEDEVLKNLKIPKDSVLIDKLCRIF